MVKLASRVEQLKIPLREPLGGVTELTGVLGIPEWWPTGSRVGIVIGHRSAGSLEDPLLVRVHAGLTEAGYLTLRFNFPFAEANRKRPDSMDVLKRAYRAAIAILGRDPTATPAHLMLAGQGLGARVAVQVAIERLRIEGLFFLGYPLHPAGKPEKVAAETLYRVISPMLFVQGARDRSCDLDTLRRTLTRIGAPTALHVIPDADARLKVPKKTGRTPDEVFEEILGVVTTWIERVLEG